MMGTAEQQDYEELLKRLGIRTPPYFQDGEPTYNIYELLTEIVEKVEESQ